ncbi:MAG: NUDIX hydrolase [Candidatus Kapaibacterium sp.]
MHPFAEHFLLHAQSPRPGRGAQERMAPRRLADGSFRSFEMPAGARENAVLLVLCEAGDGPAILLTLRSAHVNTHKGQWSLPGGRMEAGETIVEAALRETEEEVGIAKESLQVLGRLTSLYTPPSHSIIHPVVAWWSGSDRMKSNAVEVEETLLAPVSSLFHHHAIEEEWDYQGTPMIVPQWKIHPRAPLWGATAIIVSEFMTEYTDWLHRTTDTARNREGSASTHL